ncbi:MAG TPA: hypothetical protein VMN78_06450 [Longimicrobiales bacterium]|nr:hypothetical protein [Longimicrobiales bacterium]
MTRSRNRGAALFAVAPALSLAAPHPAAAQGPVLGGTLGGVGGLVAGTTVTLGLIVANARMERDFIHGPEDIISPRRVHGGRDRRLSAPLLHEARDGGVGRSGLTRGATRRPLACRGPAALSPLTGR